MSKNQQLNEQLEYMYGLERFGIKLGLEVMTQLLVALGNPHQAFPSVHITGTNGKGSTASFIAHMLRAGGYTVGLYTSPHLTRFNERIQINGEPLTDASLGKLIEEVRAVTTAQGITVTFFEFTTAVAFLYFARQGVDIAVIEAGMGGLLDATNVVMPEVSIITNVGLEHVPYIGRTEREIAQNKAGIIKAQVPVVTAEPKPEITALLADVARERGASFHEVARELAVEPVQQSLDGQTFTCQGIYNGEFAIQLLGEHQLTNAAAALVAMHLLASRGFAVPIDQLRQGLAEAEWPGRLDVVSRDPFILIDGAHNNHGVESLVAYLDRAPLPPPGVLVLGKKNDKDLRLMYEKVVPRFQHVIVTEGNYEAAPAVVLAQEVQAYHTRVEAIPDLRQAIIRATELLEAEHMMLIAGSLYMVGDVLAILQEKR